MRRGYHSSGERSLIQAPASIRLLQSRCKVFILRANVLRPQPSSFAASWRCPLVRAKVISMSVFSNSGMAFSISPAQVGRDVLGRDDITRRCNCQPTCHVDALPDVAGPAKREQRFHGSSIEAFG